jgi:hypothetical protein
MMRIVAASFFAVLLAACSGSDRVEGIVPGWANTSPQPAIQYGARRNQLEGRVPVAAEQKPAAAPQGEARKPAGAPQQEAKKPESQSSSEE